MNKREKNRFVRNIYRYLQEAKVLNLPLRARVFKELWTHTSPKIKKALSAVYNYQLESIEQVLNINFYRTYSLNLGSDKYRIVATFNRKGKPILGLQKKVFGKYMDIRDHEIDLIYKKNSKVYSQKDNVDKKAKKVRKSRDLYGIALSTLTSMLNFMIDVKGKIDMNTGKSWDNVVYFYAVYSSDDKAGLYGFTITWKLVKDTIAIWSDKVLKTLDPIMKIDQAVIDVITDLTFDPRLYFYLEKLKTLIRNLVLLEHPKGEFHHVNLRKVKMEVEHEGKGEEWEKYRKLVDIGIKYLDLFREIFDVIKELHHQISERKNKVSLGGQWEKWVAENFEKL